MKISVGPRGVLEIDDAQICYKNFAGKGSPYNREGERNFSVVIPDRELADRLVADGWNVRIREPKVVGEEPFMHLPVKVKFNDFGPEVCLESGKAKAFLNEDTVACLDNARLSQIDLTIRPYDWKLATGKSGRAAYLQDMYAVQSVSRFADRWDDIEPDFGDDDLPFDM